MSADASIYRHDPLDVGIETAYEKYVRENHGRHEHDQQLRAAAVRSYEVVDKMFGPAEIFTASELFDDASGMTHVAAAAVALRVVNRGYAAVLRHAARAQESAAFRYDDPIEEIDATGEVLGRELGVSPYKAKRWIATGRYIYGVLLRTGDAMDRGEVSIDKAQAIADALSGTPLQVAHAVEERIVRSIETTTATQLRRDIARMLTELAPDNADELHVGAASRRNVSRPINRAHSMSMMRLELTVEQASSIDAALDGAAMAALKAGDCRTYHQLRADALASWAIRAMRGGWLFETTCGTEIEVPPTKLKVTVPLEVLARALPGWAPHRDVADIYDDLYGRDPDTARATRNLVLGAGGISDRIEDAAGNGVGRVETAWLEGYGPIAPAVAIMLAAGGTWQRIVTDALTGAPLDVGRERYRPPAAIMDAVRVRDLMCQSPGCTNPADPGEVDHIVEWHDGGQTRVANLILLCARCHRRKSARIERLIHVHRDGSRTWQTPMGQITRPPIRAPRKAAGQMLTLPGLGLDGSHAPGTHPLNLSEPPPF